MTEAKATEDPHRAALMWTLLITFAALPCAVHLPEPHPLWSVAVLLVMGMVHALLLGSALVLALAGARRRWPAAPRWAAGAGAAGLLGYVALDAMSFGLVKHHLGVEPANAFIAPEMLLAYDVGPLDVLGFAGWIALLVGLGLTQSRALPAPRRALRLVAAALLAEVALGLLGATVRYLGVQPLVGLVEGMPLAFRPRLDGVLWRLWQIPPQAIDDDSQFPNPLGSAVELHNLLPLPLPLRAERTPDVLIVVLDSLRADAVADMPQLQALAKASLVADAHRSSGNCASLGVYGLLTGASPTLWPLHKTWLLPRGLAAFTALGYEVSLRQSGQLPPETQARALPPRTLLAMAGPRLGLLGRDALSVAWASEWLRHPGPQPRLAVVMLDATHWPYPAPGEPLVAPPLPASWLARDQTDALQARYRRSTAGADARLGAIIAAAQAAHHFDDLALVVLGGNGEAFREHGVFGHGTRLDDEQLRVPLVMKLPGVAAGHLAGPSTHSDVLPTLLGYLGATPLAASPAFGVDLLHGEARALPPLVASCAQVGPDGFAAVQGDDKVLFQIDPLGARFVDARDADGLALDLSATSPQVKALLAAEMQAYQSLQAPMDRESLEPPTSP